MVGDFNDKRSSKIFIVVSVQVAVKAKIFLHIYGIILHSVSISAKVSLKLSNAMRCGGIGLDDGQPLVAMLVCYSSPG